MALPTSWLHQLPAPANSSPRAEQGDASTEAGSHHAAGYALTSSFFIYAPSDSVTAAGLIVVCLNLPSLVLASGAVYTALGPTWVSAIAVPALLLVLVGPHLNLRKALDELSDKATD